MGSLFINAGIAAGVGLAALPFILHLFFRQTPKRVIFPALQLVRERQKRSRKKLKVKNWLLLLARMALIALMALALARPRLWSNTRLSGEEVPTALALVFDTSLSMEYKERDKTRLDEAKERARALLKKAHEASRVFVIDSSEPIAPVALSPTAALKRVDALVIRPVNRPLNAAVGVAYKAVAGAEQARHEVYVFTDLARTAWDAGRPADGLDAAKKDGPALATFVVRLAPKALRNASVVEAEPAVSFTSQGDEIPIRAVIRNVGPATTRVAEFLVDGTKRDQQSVQVPADGEVVARFKTPNKLGPGPHSVLIRLAGAPDPLERDDRRHLTLDIQPALRVLVISDVPEDADWLANALDPTELQGKGARPFPVQRLTTRQFRESFHTPLRDFAAVFLLNARDLNEADWGRLNSYVREGGGLVLAPGSRVEPEPLNEAARALLPATLGELKVPAEPAYFGKADVAHPLFERNTRDLLSELSRWPVAKYRAAAPIEGSRVLLSYTNDDPALLERVFPGPRAGRVLLWTTSLSRRPGTTAAEREATWTEFPLSWSFLALMDATVPYVAGLSGRRLNYEAGEDVVLPVEPGQRDATYLIEGPGTKPEKIGETAGGGGGLLISAPPLIGDWKVTATGGGQTRPYGFSVNVPQAETQLAPLAEPDLAVIFGGKDRVTLVDDPSKLEKVIIQGRTGRELFPWLMALILLIVTAENVLANTFYRDRPAASTEAPTPGRAAA
jgi:hypothetical protein